MRRGRLVDMGGFEFMPVLCRPHDAHWSMQINDRGVGSMSVNVGFVGQENAARSLVAEACLRYLGQVRC
jgi:hypothetical protein